MRLFRNQKQEGVELQQEENVPIEHLADVDQMVLDYVKSPSTDYAIMLKGAWGAGKTFYWNNALAYDIEQIDSPVKNDDGVKKYKAVRVSLFGIESLNSLVMRITRAKYLQSDNKWVNSALLVGETTAKNIAKRYGIDAEELESIVSAFKDIDQKRFVFCFDDLERVSEDLLLEVLGYINTMVEGEKVKVVILCNEEELLKSIGDTSKYLAYKEKLIRFTFQMSADIEKVLPSLLENRVEGFKEYILSNKDFIIDFYQKGNCDNIRTLKFNIEVYQQLFILISSMDLKAHKDAILSHYLMLSMLYAIEYKSGVVEEDLQELLDLTSERSYAIDLDIETFNRLAGLETDENKELNYIQKVKKKYFKGPPAKIGSSSSFLDYMKTGRFDRVQLASDVNNTLSILQDKEITEEQQLLSKLNGVWFLEDEELGNIVDQLIDKANSGILSLDLYPSAFVRIDSLITGGFIKGPNTNDLKKAFQLGIKRAKPRTKYDEAFEQKYQISVDEMNADAQEIAREVLQIYRDLGREEGIKRFQDSLTHLWTQSVDMREFTSSHYPLLASLKPKTVFTSFSEADNAGKFRFVSFFRDRVASIRNRGSDEEQFLSDFKSLCDGYIASHKTPSIKRKYCVVLRDMLKNY